MGDFDVNWDFNEILSTLDTEANRTKGLTLDAIEEVGKDIRDEAKKRCPVRTGALQKTGRVRVRKGRTARREVVTVTFGGQKAPYAVPVHYDPNLPLKNGEHRFLENAVNHVASPDKLPEVVSRKYKAK